jgi:hypothetical protein
LLSDTRKVGKHRGRGFPWPAGIIAVDHLGSPPSPIVCAYVWSRERVGAADLPSNGEARGRRGALLVGPRGALRAIGAGNGLGG